MGWNLLRASVCLVMCASLTASPLPQQATPEELSTPSIRVTTRLVLADVVVTDKSGQRVKNLTKDDFTILENGKPQKIAAFSFESAGFDKNPPKLPPLPEHVYTNRPQYNSPSGPLTIILLDGINTALGDQGYARSQMLKYLATQIQPGQRFAVYTLAGSLRLLQDFTDDVNLLKVAIEHFTPQKSLEQQIQAIEAVMPNVRVTGDTGVRGAGGSVGRVTALITQMDAFLSEQVQYAVEARVRRTTAAMRLLARRVAGYPGRKNLLWVSAGFPMDITSQVVQHTTDVDVVAQGATASVPQIRVDKSYEDAVKELAADLTDSQVSVYSVDARGLIGSTMTDASSEGRNAAGMATMGAEFGASLARSSAATYDTQNTLVTLASESGGLTFKNSNDVAGAVADSVVDGSAYYLVGYYPESRQFDGKFRKIQIKVNRPDIVVRHRMGYFAKDPTQWTKSKEKEDPDLQYAMELGGPTATMVIFDTRVVPPPPGPKVKVPVDILVNPSSVSGDDKDGGKHFVLEFHVAAYNADGKIAGHVDNTLDAPVKADRLQTLMQQGILARPEIELGPGNYRLRVAVRDARTGYIGTTELPLTLAAK